jgi:iron-sulfur cluster repair protein YtfE (RIC family)
MDIIDYFLENHAALRAELEALASPFKRTHGVGWDDCVVLDQNRLFQNVTAFIASVKEHELQEDEVLSEVCVLLEEDAKALAALAEGRRSLREILKLFNVIAYNCDGEHVHRVRELLFRLREELEPHLEFEEKVLFPLLRARLPAKLLRELGSGVQAGGARGHAKR